MLPMSLLVVEYDAVRSGFMLQVDGFERSAESRRSILRSDITVHLTSAGKFAALESNYALPLRRVQCSEDGNPGCPHTGTTQWQAGDPRPQTPKELAAVNSPWRDMPVEGNEWRRGLFLLRQQPSQFSLWFVGTDEIAPRINWIREDLPEFGLTLWFSQRHIVKQRRNGNLELPLLAGLALDFAATEKSYPITRARLTPMDFK